MALDVKCSFRLNPETGILQVDCRPTIKPGVGKQPVARGPSPETLQRRKFVREFVADPQTQKDIREELKKLGEKRGVRQILGRIAKKLLKGTPIGKAIVIGDVVIKEIGREIERREKGKKPRTLPELEKEILRRIFFPPGPEVETQPPPKTKPEKRAKPRKTRPKPPAIDPKKPPIPEPKPERVDPFRKARPKKTVETPTAPKTTEPPKTPETRFPVRLPPELRPELPAEIETQIPRGPTRVPTKTPQRTPARVRDIPAIFIPFAIPPGPTIKFPPARPKEKEKQGLTTRDTPKIGSPGTEIPPPPPALAPPVVDFDVPALGGVPVFEEALQATRAQEKRKCREVKEKKNRTICRQGYFEEKRNSTEFVTWRTVDCATGRTLTTDKTAGKVARRILKTFGG